MRDGIQFPDLVHSLRPNPKTNIQEGWRILDFLSHHPESCHIVRLPFLSGFGACMAGSRNSRAERRDSALRS